MKLEVGKRYVRRDGKISDTVELSGGFYYKFSAGGLIYTEEGRWLNEREDRPEDLVSEYIESPAAVAHQVGGSHYKDLAIQPAEFVHTNGLGFLEGNVIKYVCRYKAKNGRQDLEKARHYIDLLLQYQYPEKAP